MTILRIRTPVHDMGAVSGFSERITIDYYKTVFCNFQISLCVVKLRVIVAKTFILSLVGQVSSLFFRKVELQGLKINTSS